MKMLNKLKNQLLVAYSRAQKQPLSLRVRFSMYLLTIISSFLMLLLLLLNFTGIISTADKRLHDNFQQQLDTTSTMLSSNMNHNSVYVAELSQALTPIIERYLGGTDDVHYLDNNLNALEAIQRDAYTVLEGKMDVGICSGAFFILNATANNQLDNKSNSALYLKYSNIYAEKSTKSDICMFRGIPAIARENNLNLHSSWQMEFNSFKAPELNPDNIAQYFPGQADPRLSLVYALPNTWEDSRFVYMPIYSSSGKILGVCGLEISNILFHISYQLPDIQDPYTVFALFTESTEGYQAQLSSNRSGYIPCITRVLSITKNGNLEYFSNGDSYFVGLSKKFAVGNSNHLTAIVLTAPRYEYYVDRYRNKVILIIILVLISTSFICFYLSKTYVQPFLRSINQIKKQENVDYVATGIAEVDDMLETLSRRNADKQQMLTELQKSKQYLEQLQQEHQSLNHQYALAHSKYQEAQASFIKTKDEYARAQAEYAQAQEDYQKVQQQLEFVQDKLTNLGKQKLQEVDIEEYHLFLQNLATLTPKEREIFDYYIQGFNGKQISEIMEITANTLKYHNKNIYSKLGVKSRKELRLFATLMTEK